MKFNTKNIVRQLVLIILLIIAFLLPRVFSIGHFIAVDEVNWLHRSANFYDAVVRKDWSNTYVNNSPGVITTWVGSLAYKIAAPSYRVTRDIQKTSYLFFENNLIKKTGVKPLVVLAYARVIMILLVMIVWLLSYFYAQRLFGILPSFIGFLVIALNPFFIALTRMNHLDAPQAAFMFLSILSFLHCLIHRNRWFDVVISGIAGGLAFLSKLPGIFVIPTIGLIAVWESIRTKPKGKDGLSILADNKIKKLIQSLLIWALIFLFTYSAVWPSMWVQPVRTLEKVFNTSSKYSSAIMEVSISKQNEDTNIEASRTLVDYLRYPESFLWRTTPIVLLGLILLLITFKTRKDNLANKSITMGVQGLLIFLVVYTIGITLPTKSSEKYYAPAYLVLDFLAGLGWYYFLFSRTNEIRTLGNRYIRYAILTVVIITQSVWVLQSFPYYYTYYNPLLGGLKKAAQERFIGVGEGLDQAGLYLLRKPESSELKVMAWYGVGPLSYYFNGTVVPLYMSNSIWTPEFITELRKMDYLVTYTNQKFRNQPPELFSLLSGVTPEYTISIDGAEYAWIYRVSDLPIPEPEQEFNQ